MTRLTALAIAALIATPARAAGDYPFLSLYNTDFVVAIAFVIFGAILWYFGVHRMVTDWLDGRAARIREDLDEARRLREDAQALQASYERKHTEVQAQADRIIENARKEAAQSAREARADLERSVERRKKAAEDQIASAEAAAIRDIRNRAAAIATAAAGDVIAKQMTADAGNALIDASIRDVEKRLN